MEAVQKTPEREAFYKKIESCQHQSLACGGLGFVFSGALCLEFVSKDR